MVDVSATSLSICSRAHSFHFCPPVFVESLNKKWVHEGFPGSSVRLRWGVGSVHYSPQWSLWLRIGTPILSWGTHWLLSWGPCKLTPGSQTQRPMGQRRLTDEKPQGEVRTCVLQRGRLRQLQLTAARWESRPSAEASSDFFNEEQEILLNSLKSLNFFKVGKQPTEK